jgi:hypothetical protein
MSGMVAIIVALFLQTTLTQWKQWQCEGTPAIGRYINYAKGFSVAAPPDIQGRRGQSSGPERGVAYPLSQNCIRVVVVFGESNSLEWSTPSAAINWTVQASIEKDPQARINRYTTWMGKLNAAGATIRHKATSDIEEIVIAFRPGGGPVYQARLVFLPTQHDHDFDIFERVLREFRIEPWR